LKSFSGPWRDDAGEPNGAGAVFPNGEAVDNVRVVPKGAVLAPALPNGDGEGTRPPLDDELPNGEGFDRDFGAPKGEGTDGAKPPVLLELNGVDFAGACRLLEVANGFGFGEPDTVLRGDGAIAASGALVDDEKGSDDVIVPISD
jgi:hypothetical protein